MSSSTNDMDFKALYQSSLKLTSSIDDFGIPPLEKGLEQLDHASRAFQQQRQQEFTSGGSGAGVSGRTGTTTTGFAGRSSGSTTGGMDRIRKTPAGGKAPAFDKANFLLATRGIDAEKLTKELQTFELNPTFQPETPLGETDIEGYLAHHHEMVLLTAIEEANQRTIEATHNRMNQSIIDEFQRAKQKFLEELGAAPSQMGARNYPRIPEVDTNKNQLFGARNAFGKPLVFGQAPPPSSNMPTAASLQQMSRQMKIDSTMTEEMKLYVRVIEELNANRVPHTRNQFDLLGAFKRIATENVSSSVVGTKWECVLKCWQLLSSMLVGINNRSSYSLAERSLDLTQMDESERALLSHRFVFGARIFLEEQFRSFLFQTVQKQKLATGGVPDLLSSVRAFVRFLQSSKYATAGAGMESAVPSTSTSSSSNSSNIWAVLYYCLRCGGEQEAVELVNTLLRSGTDTSVDSDILCGLRYRAHEKKVYSDPQAAPLGTFSKQFPQEYERLIEKYHRLSNSSLDITSHAVNVYERCVLNLLCYGNPNASEPRILTTIEDYLWQRLLFIQRRRRSNTTFSLGENTEAYTIARLAKSIEKFGPNHFESVSQKRGSSTSTDLSSFLYFQILLMTQEFEKALNYLASKGFLLEAVHFAITLQYYGLLKTFASEENSSTSNMMMDVDPMNQSSIKQQEKVDFVKFLRQYVHLFQRTNACEAAQYYACIPDVATKKQLFADLLLETTHFDILAGYTNHTDGSRTRGLYDRLYVDATEADLKDIVLMASRKAEQRGLYHQSFQLLQIAGDIENVILLLNTMLGNVLSGNKPERDEWFRLAKEFAEKWMRFPWVQAIANKFARSSAIAFQTLLNMYIFLDLIEAKQQYQEAIRFMEQLDILPVNGLELAGGNDLSICVDRFLSLDENVRKNFHLVLLGYVECLVREADRIKTEVFSLEAKRTNIAHLRERAELVVTFAGMIKFRLPSGTNERLNRMEAMIY